MTVMVLVVDERLVPVSGAARVYLEKKRNARVVHVVLREQRKVMKLQNVPSQENCKKNRTAIVAPPSPVRYLASHKDEKLLTLCLFTALASGYW